MGRASGAALVPLLLVVVMATVFLLIAAKSGASASTAVSMEIDVGSPSDCVSIEQGAQIVVSVRVSTVQELQGWEATIVHDDSVLQVIEHEAKVFFGQTPDNIFDASEPLPDSNGRHFLSAGILGETVSGSGVLGTLTFQAIGTGFSQIDIPQTDFDQNGTVDEGARLLKVGSVIDDVNGDGFFDGPVDGAIVAVGQECGAIPTVTPTKPPTSAPSPTASPTPSPTPTFVGTPAPGSPTATPSTSTSSPTHTPAPTASLVPGAELVWGDANCSGEVNPVDGLLTLRHDAGLSTDTSGCPQLGQVLNLASVASRTWGDVDCSGQVNPVDALKVLRFDAGLDVAAEGDCPPLGSDVVIAPDAG